MEIKNNVIVGLDQKDFKRLVIPASVVGVDIFNESVYVRPENFAEIAVENGNPVYKVINGCLVDIKTKTLVLGVDYAAIPDDGSVERIAPYAFNMRSVSTLTIPSVIKEIGYMAFASLNCNNMSGEKLHIEIPIGVEKIAERAFSMNNNIELTVNSDNTYYYVQGGCLIERNSDKFICAYGKTVCVPKCVTALPKFAFLFEALDSIILHDKITEIGKDAFLKCGVRYKKNLLSLPCKIAAPHNSYAWRYLARNKIDNRIRA